MLYFIEFLQIIALTLISYSTFVNSKEIERYKNLLADLKIDIEIYEQMKNHEAAKKKQATENTNKVGTWKK